MIETFFNWLAKMIDRILKNLAIAVI